ncbi:MAG: TIGR01777 family oxidoreductase [Patiriisocius sp.]|uniref:TIGR01777 family oxidoreductase n=1 Tax=Patiriisocius sp. TaxID=2822396 RepID=UPI003EF34881
MKTKTNSIIIAGGTGYLGQVLIDYFKNKTEHIYILSRNIKEDYENVTHLLWDAKNLGDWINVFENANVLINLTGKSVDCRYNAKNKNLILSSRVDSTNVLGKAIEQCENPPRIWLNSSTATIYRHSLEKQMDEVSGELGDGFSVNVAKAWEQIFFGFKLRKTRQVAMRTSIVFGNCGGAFEPIKTLVKIGMGGKQGPGNQKVSFIHEVDFARSIEFIIANEIIEGVINIVSPTPTTNKELMQTLRKQLNVPFGIPMPKMLLEIGAVIIKTETELILKSRNVIPTKLHNYGFKFKFPTLSQTISNLVN